jgi:hypothetical protein
MYLLPTHWKWPGALLSLAGIALHVLVEEIPWLAFRVRAEGTLLKPAVENFTNELALTLLVVGLLILAFTRERDEDERIRLIRLEAFQWGMLVNFLIVLAANWVLYGGDFLSFMLFNLFTPLIVFLLRFYYVLYIREPKAEKSGAAL